jgi:multidrug transporter EmrE-like cation transporter
MKGVSLKYALWLGSAFVFVSLVAMFYMNRIDILALAAFVFGIVVVVGTLSRFNQCGSPRMSA